MLTGDAYSSRRLVPAHLGLAYVQPVETNLFPELFVIFFRTIHFEHHLILSRFCFGHMYPPSLRSKTRPRETLLFPTWIYSCQSIGTVNFAPPFTTSVRILIFILQTFRSWVATSRLHPHMAFFISQLIRYSTRGLAPLMNVLFWGRCDFPISFSGTNIKKTFGIVS